jgi:addiction module HigA family antidote
MTTIKRPASGWDMQRVATHPGEILRDEFMGPLKLSQNALALKIRVPATRIFEIINGRRAMSPDTALRLARFFGSGAEFWMNLQQMYDLSKARMESSKEIEQQVQVYAAS